MKEYLLNPFISCYPVSVIYELGKSKLLMFTHKSKHLQIKPL